MNLDPRGPSPQSVELARLNAHFMGVLGRLEARRPRLSMVQRKARALHLDRLERYRRRGRFPKNLRFAGKFLPHFIDEVGTRCAMGHLIEASGERDLVQYIARKRNYARVPELADIPELVLWLEANGLTLEEATQIQPEYCGPPSHNCLCGNAFGAGVIEGTLGDGGTRLTVTEVYGPVTGVAPGAVLDAQDTRGVGTSFDVVFASLGGDAKTAFIKFGSTQGEVNIPLSACWFPQVASIPGSLPLAVVRSALSSSSIQDCQKALSDFDSEWAVVQGGADCQQTRSTGGATGAGGTTSAGGATGAGGALDAGTQATSADDGGCAVSPHAAGNSALVLAVSAAYVVREVRRSKRRR